jgi:hypothetical protein
MDGRTVVPIEVLVHRNLEIALAARRASDREVLKGHSDRRLDLVLDFGEMLRGQLAPIRTAVLSRLDLFTQPLESLRNLLAEIGLIDGRQQVGVSERLATDRGAVPRQLRRIEEHFVKIELPAQLRDPIVQSLVLGEGARIAF